MAVLAIHNDPHPGKHGVLFNRLNVPGLVILKRQLCAGYGVVERDDFYRRSGPAVFFDGDLMGSGNNGYLSRSQAEQSHTGRVFTQLECFIPAAAA